MEEKDLIVTPGDILTSSNNRPPPPIKQHKVKITSSTLEPPGSNQICFILDDSAIIFFGGGWGWGWGVTLEVSLSCRPMPVPLGDL